MDHDVELTYRLGPPWDGIIATFKIPGLTDDPEAAVEQARNLLDGVVGSALNNAELTQATITAARS